MKHQKNRFDHLITQRSVNFRAAGASLILFLLLAATACQKSETIAPSGSSDQNSFDLKLSHANNYEQVNLVADVVDEYNPQHIDPNLVNAWGMAFDDEGEIWVSSADKGLSTIYNDNGQTLMPPVNIPFGMNANGGAPTGIVYNATSDFTILGTNEPSEFIWATENGTIAAWNDPAGSNAVIVANNSSSGAVYKGLTMGKNGGANYLYATNFKQAKIDVFDASFNSVNMPFNDPNMPAGFAPFNIKYLDGKLYVTYAKQLAPDNEDDEAGPGNGFVDIYNTDGSFVQRFISQGRLNSPWGIAKAAGTNVIGIGNFGDGRINIYNSNGTFSMTLKKDGAPLEIEGLWAIVFPGKNLPDNERNRLYFTAGPDEESHGLFGYIKPAQ
ncbi:MAG TPA: TIGR03118 family protein [Chitinophagales bacterium]|nr:TIGR03118 family protein [Chitinophagales bacterium]